MKYGGAPCTEEGKMTIQKTEEKQRLHNICLDLPALFPRPSLFWKRLEKNILGSMPSQEERPKRLTAGIFFHRKFQPDHRGVICLELTSSAHMLKGFHQLLGHLLLNMHKQLSTFLRKDSNKKETNIKRNVGATIWKKWGTMFQTEKKTLKKNLTAIEK